MYSQKGLLQTKWPDSANRRKKPLSAQRQRFQILKLSSLNKKVNRSLGEAIDFQLRK
jgi:hypothetical protein